MKRTGESIWTDRTSGSQVCGFSPYETVEFSVRAVNSAGQGQVAVESGTTLCEGECT